MMKNVKHDEREESRKRENENEAAEGRLQLLCNLTNHKVIYRAKFQQECSMKRIMKAFFIFSNSDSTVPVTHIPAKQLVDFPRRCPRKREKSAQRGETCFGWNEMKM